MCFPSCCRCLKILIKKKIKHQQRVCLSLNLRTLLLKGNRKYGTGAWSHWSRLTTFNQSVLQVILKVIHSQTVIGQYSFYFSKSYIHCKKCLCIITLKCYQSCDDSMWLVESGYSVWGHQNDSHVITSMNQHTLRLRPFPVCKGNWNSKLSGMQFFKKINKKTPRTNMWQLDGTCQDSQWTFNRCFLQNEAWCHIQNWKLA